MTDESSDYKLGKLVSRVTAVEADILEIKNSTQEISDALTKGKGVFIGLMLAAASGGAFLSDLVKKWIA